MANETNTRKAKNVNYAIFATAVVIAIVLVVNLFIRAVDTKFTKISVSPTDIYTLSEITENLLNTIDKDVTIYTIAETGSEDIAVETIVDRYVSLNKDKIKHEKVDPTVDNSFIADNIGQAVRQGSLLVKCGENKVFIDIADMRYTVNTQSGESREMVDVEGLITAAIAKVTSDHTPKAYVLMADGRTYLETSIIEAIEKQNVNVTEIKLKDEELPEDAELIILYQPPTDITDKEYEAIKKVMDKGGSFLYIMCYDYKGNEEKENISTLFRQYGMSFPLETVIEGNSDNYVDGEFPFQIYPIIKEHEITKNHIEEELKVLFNMSGRIEIDEVPSTAKVDVFLKTTPQAYIRVNGDTSTTFDPNKDFRSEYNLAASIVDSTNDSKTIVYSSYTIADVSSDTEVNGANTELLVNSICWLTEQEQIVSVPAKFRGLSKLVYTAKEKNTLLAATVFIIPAAFLGWGLIVWIRRRRK